MTPEEKAKDMVEYFVKLIGDKSAGVCAAGAACDEVINEIEPDSIFKNYNERVSYWKDVKEAIEKF